MKNGLVRLALNAFRRGGINAVNTLVSTMTNEERNDMLSQFEAMFSVGLNDLIKIGLWLASIRAIYRVEPIPKYARCPVCNSRAIVFGSENEGKRYAVCNDCLAVFPKLNS